MFAAPDPTAYDLRFRALGIPVRVHPTFWLTMAILGGALNVGMGNSDLTPVLVFTGVGLVSILVHEFGHALAYKACGQWPRVVLYYLGGLAIGSGEERLPGRRLAIILAGPGAGFLLLAATLAAGALYFGQRPETMVALCGTILGMDISSLGTLGEQLFRNRIAGMIFLDLVEINLLWTLVNLLPVFPLDGGQAAGVLLGLRGRHRGQTQLHVLSIITAGAVAFYFLWTGGGRFVTAIFFGVLALQNFQMLQAMRHLRSASFGEDADDWWRR